MAKKGKLTDRQIRFCQEYVIDLSSKEAALRAGYSKRSAKHIGSENLTKPIIQQEIARLQKGISIKAEMDAKYVLKKLKDILEADVTEFIDMSKEELKGLPKEVRTLIKSMTSTTTKFGAHNEHEKTVVKIVLMDKDHALDVVCRHIGFFSEDNSQKTPNVVIQNGLELP